MDIHLSVRVGNADANLLSGGRVLCYGATGDDQRWDLWGGHLLHNRWFGSHHLVYRLQLSNQRG